MNLPINILLKQKYSKYVTINCEICNSMQNKFANLKPRSHE